MNYSALLLILLILLSSHPLYAGFGFRSEYRFNFDSGLCLNERNEVGLNSGTIGECGDLRKITRRKLEKTALFKLNLRASNCEGVDLSGLDLEESNLYMARLHNANLKDALVNRTIFEGARFNNKTILPFKESTALAYGMINDDYPANPKITITAKDLEDESPEYILSGLKSEKRPSVAYHERLKNLVREAREIRLSILNSVIKSSFYSLEDLNEFTKQKEGATSPLIQYYWSLKEEDAYALSLYINEIILSGIKRADDTIFLSYLNTLNLLFPAHPNYNTYGPTNSAFIEVLNRFTRLDRSALGLLLKSAESKKAQTAVASIAERLYQIENKPNASALKELLLNRVSPENREQVMSESIKSVLSLSRSELYDLLPLVIKDGRDALLLHYLTLKDQITVDDILEIAPLAYNVSHDIRLNFLNKIESLDLEALKRLITIYQDKEKTTLLSLIISRIELDTLDTLYELGRLAGDPLSTRDFVVLHYQKVKNWNLSGVAKISTLLQEEQKDNLVLYYSPMIKNLTTYEFSQLLGVTFSKHFEIIDQNITKVTDLTSETLISLGRGYYYGHGMQRDAIFIKSLKHLVDLNEKNLERIVYFAAYDKESIRTLGREILNSRD